MHLPIILNDSIFNSHALFCLLQIFDKNWHKIHFGVYRQQVILYVDCEQTTSEFLEARGPIDVNGVITISKLANGNRQTVPVCTVIFISLIYMFLQKGVETLVTDYLFDIIRDRPLTQLQALVYHPNIY